VSYDGEDVEARDKMLTCRICGKGKEMDAEYCWYTVCREVVNGLPKFIVDGMPVANLHCYREGRPDGDYIIEQCTGVFDHEGKLIYEGDIVSIEWDAGTAGYQKTVAVVRWSGTADEFSRKHTAGCWIWDDFKRRDCMFYDHMEFTILSNIHENPELLEPTQ
jgi:uncharacterized phage protein (TIGR01671 family)